MGWVSRGYVVKKLGIERDIDYTVPQSFQDCLLYDEENSNCGFNPEPNHFVWHYRKGSAMGMPLHLGEEVLDQLGEGKIYLITKEEMIEFENLRRDKRLGEI